MIKYFLAIGLYLMLAAAMFLVNGIDFWWLYLIGALAAFALAGIFYWLDKHPEKPKDGDK